MFHRVIVPLDGSQWSEKALEYGVEVAERFGAQLTLLRAYKGAERSMRGLAMAQAQPDALIGITPSLVEAVSDAAQDDEAQSRAYLEGIAAPLRARGINVESRVVDGPAMDAILKEVNRSPETLVIMCTHGRTGIERLLAGNVAQQLLQKSRVPVLLLRLAGSDPTAEGVDLSMDVSIGTEVMGKSGKLGEVHRVIVDARSGHVTDIVVKHGFIFETDRIVPLSHVSRVENGVAVVDLDEAGFEAMNGFADDRYHAPDPSYVGPPGFDHGEFLIDSMMASGSAAGPGYGTPPMGFPGGEATSPVDMQRPAISAGTDVLDVNGAKVGEVGNISLSPEDGRPTHITLRQGRIFHRETSLPLEWLDELSDEGVMLKVTKSEVDALTNRDKK